MHSLNQSADKLKLKEKVRKGSIPTKIYVTRDRDTGFDCEVIVKWGDEVLYKGEKRGWRKSLGTLKNLRQPLSIIREVDND